MTPYYQDDYVTLYHGDATTTLDKLPEKSVDCIITSPPYFGLRNYGEDGQIGVEETPEAYVDSLLQVFRKAKNVLSDTGTLWLNVGDTYAGEGGGNYGQGKSVRSQGGQQLTNVRNRKNAPQNGGLPPKSLMGMPWRVAFALQAEGWILRNDIIWEKPNAMPEPVKDRMTNRHEHVFLFSKSPTYWFDLDPIREPHTTAAEVTPWTQRKYDQSFLPPGRQQANGVKGRVSGVAGYSQAGKNPGDVWKINTKPFSEAHFATMPPELAERCVKAACQPGGTVLDPFSGSGTTGMAAIQQGRKYVGIDINEDYLELSLSTRLSQQAFNFA